MYLYKAIDWVDEKVSELEVIVKDELFTEREVKKYKIPLSLLERVNVRADKIYWSFGARFAFDDI